MTVRDVIFAAIAAGSFVACGGAMASGDPDAEGSAGGAMAMGASGGARSTGGVPGTGGAENSVCPSKTTSPGYCPLDWSRVLEVLGAPCTDKPPPAECWFEDVQCRLRTAYVFRAHTSIFCQYDELSGTLVGQIASGRGLSCESFSPDFPPDGFLRNECGPGSFDPGGTTTPP